MYSVGSRENAAGWIVQSLAEMDTAASASDSEIVQTGQRVVFDSPESMPGWIKPAPAPTTTRSHNPADRRRGGGGARERDGGRAIHVANSGDPITVEDDDFPAPTPPTSNRIQAAVAAMEAAAAVAAAAAAVAAEKETMRVQIQRPSPADSVQTQRSPPANIMFPSDAPPVPDMKTVLADSSSSSDTDDGPGDHANQMAGFPELDRLPSTANNRKDDSENNAYEVGSSSSEDANSQDLYSSARKKGVRLASKRTNVVLSAEDEDEDDSSQHLKRLKKVTPDRRRTEPSRTDALATSGFERTAEAHAVMADAEDHSNQVDEEVSPTPSPPLSLPSLRWASASYSKCVPLW